MTLPKVVAASIGVALCCATSDAGASDSCSEDAPLEVMLTGGLGVAAGASGALISSGTIAAADDKRDFDFGIGAAVGIGVTASLSLLYAIVDGATGCSMVGESPSGVVWSIPITMLVVGSLLPIAVWGASDEIGPPADSQPTATSAALGIALSF